MAVKPLTAPDFGPDDVLGTDPRAYQPSPVPGMTRLEYDEILDQVRWMARYTLTEKLRAAQRAVAQEERFFGSRADLGP